MKKIITAAICASLILSAFSVPAIAEENASQTISSRLITSLGAVGEDFDYEHNLTRGEFVDLVIRTAGMGHFDSDKILYADVLKDHKYFSSISAAYNMGIISDAELFRPDDEVTVGEAAVILTSLIGYKPYIEVGAFMSKAADCGILDGVTKAADATINGETALLLLSNTLEAKALIHSVNGAEITDVSYMSEYLGIYKDDGIVTSDGVIDFDSDIIEEGIVKIDGIEYDYDGVLDGAIGKSVEFYYKEKEDGARVLLAYAEKNRNTVRTFNAQDISAETTVSKLVIKPDGESKKSYTIPSDVTVIYNGSSKFGFTADDIRPGVGDVTLISNDGDSTADVVIINDYYVAAAATANAKSETISFRYYDLRAGEKITKIDLKDYDRYTIIKDGERIDLGDIAEWDTVHIAENAEKTVITLLISRETVSGEISSIETDGSKTYWIIDGEKHGVSKGWCDDATTAKVGTKGVFYLDYQGKIAFCDTSTTSKSNYMILLKTGYDSEHDKAYVRVFTSSNTDARIYCAEKIRIKGYIPSEARVLEYTYKEAADIPNAIENVFANSLYNPVLIEVDDNGDLKKLTLANDRSSEKGYKGYDDDNFTIDRTASSQKFMYSWGNGCYFQTTTPIFIIPQPVDGTSAEKVKEIKSNPENWSATTFDAEIGKSSTEESRTNAKLYDVDNFNNVGLMTFEEEFVEADDSSDAETTGYNEFMVVTKNTLMLDDDDDARRKICGYWKGSYGEYWVKDETVANVSGVDVGSTGSAHVVMPNSERMFGFTSGTRKFTIWGNTGKSASKIKVGDVIQPNFNLKGEMDSFRTLYSKELEGTEVRYNAAGTAIGKGDDDDLVFVAPGEYYELSENNNLDTDAGRAVCYTAYGEITAISGTSFRYKTQYRTLSGTTLNTTSVERVRVAAKNVYIYEDGEVKQGSASDMRIGDKVFCYVRDYTCNYVYIIRD